MESDKQQIVPKVLKSLAQLFGTEVHNRRLEIPKNYGNGYCAGYVFNKHIRMLILHYELHEDVIIENPEIDSSSQMILFKFQNSIIKTDGNGILIPTIPSILITTSSMNTDTVIPVHSTMATINIEVDSEYLNSLFHSSQQSLVLQILLENTAPLLFEQMMEPSLQVIVDEIVNGSVSANFELFFLRIKAEELICRLLMEMEKRNEKQLSPLNIKDIQNIYKVKEQILEHLDKQPKLADLAQAANMSETKLKRYSNRFLAIVFFTIIKALG